MNSFSRRSIALLLTSSVVSLQFDGPLKKRVFIRGLNSSSTSASPQSNSKTDQPVTSDTTSPPSSSSATPPDHSNGQGGSSTTPDGSSAQATPAQNDKPTSTSDTTPDDKNKSSTNMTTTPVTSPSNTGSTSHSDSNKTNGTTPSSAPASNASSSVSTTTAPLANSTNTTTPTNVTATSTPENSSAPSSNATTSPSSDNKTLSENTFPVNGTVLFGNNATNTSLDSINKAAIGSNSISSSTPTTTDSSVGGAMATASGPVRPFAPNNANLASSGSSSHSGLKMWTAIIGGSVLGGLLLFVMLWYLLTWKMRTRKDVYRDMEVDFGPTAQDATWGPGADQAFPAQFPTLASSTSGSLSSSRQHQGFESPVDQRAGSRKDSVGALTRSDTNGSQPWHSAEYGGLEGPLPLPPLMHHNNELAGFNRGAAGWDPTHERWNSEEHDANPNHGAFDQVPPQVDIRHHASHNLFPEIREHQPYNTRGGNRFPE